MYYKFRRIVEDENNKTLAMARQMKAQHVTVASWKLPQYENMELYSWEHHLQKVDHRTKSHTRPGKRLQKAMERSTIFNGKIHYT